MKNALTMDEEIDAVLNESDEKVKRRFKKLNQKLVRKIKTDDASIMRQILVNVILSDTGQLEEFKD